MQTSHYASNMMNINNMQEAHLNILFQIKYHVNNKKRSVNLSSLKSSTLMDIMVTQWIMQLDYYTVYALGTVVCSLYPFEFVEYQ